MNNIIRLGDYKKLPTSPTTKKKQTTMVEILVNKREKRLICALRKFPFSQQVILCAFVDSMTITAKHDKDRE